MQRKEYQRQKNATAVEHSHVVLTDETYAARNARNDSKSSSMSGTSLTPYSEVKAMLPPLSTIAIARSLAPEPAPLLRSTPYWRHTSPCGQKSLHRGKSNGPISRSHAVVFMIESTEMPTTSASEASRRSRST